MTKPILLDWVVNDQREVYRVRILVINAGEKYVKVLTIGYAKGLKPYPTSK